ncbi:MAG: site-specific DNA-methyltransferase [bacterium]|nr:site-specific DNA-methyltransferase [bacterium]
MVIIYIGNKDSARLVWDTKPRRAPNPKDIEFQTAEVVIPNPQYLDEMHGILIGDIWLDILPINSQAIENLYFDTQKLSALLERIIKASSNEGNLVADFFTGSGTTLAVAEKLNRRWLGCELGKVQIEITIKRYVLMDISVSHTSAKEQETYHALMKLARDNFAVLIDYWAIDWDYDGITFKSQELLKEVKFEGALKEFEKARADLVNGDYSGAIQNSNLSVESVIKGILKVDKAKPGELYRALIDSKLIPEYYSTP